MTTCQVQKYVELETLGKYKPIIFILVIILIIALLVVIGFFVKDNTNPIDDNIIGPSVTPDSVQESLLTDNIGSSDDGIVTINNGSSFTDSASCLKGVQRFWGHTGNQTQPLCGCKIPFYGKECDLESQKNSYYTLGNPDENDIEFGKKSDNPGILDVDRISFNFYRSKNHTLDGYPDEPTGTVPLIPDETFCSSMCDERESCIGFKFEPGFPVNGDISGSILTNQKSKCTLIDDFFVLVPDGKLPYDPTIQSDFYLKVGVSPEIKDRVFVYIDNTSNPPELPLRYWLSDSRSSTKGTIRQDAVFFERLLHINYVPTAHKNTTGGALMESGGIEKVWTGIYSNETFSKDDIDCILDGTIEGDQEFVIIPPTFGTTILDLPDTWRETFICFTIVSNG